MRTRALVSHACQCSDATTPAPADASAATAQATGIRWRRGIRATLTDSAADGDAERAQPPEASHEQHEERDEERHPQDGLCAQCRDPVADLVQERRLVEERDEKAAQRANQ